MSEKNLHSQGNANHSRRSKPSIGNFQSVSFIIPAHDEQNYLPETLKALTESIEVLQLQHEIIVVNDASIDETRGIAEQWGAKVLDVDLRNIGAVRNAGAQAAQYPWLFFIDADTQVPAKTLRGGLEALANGDVGGGARVGLSDELPIPLFKYTMVLLMVLVWQILGGWAAGCFMFCRKDLFLEFGGFDEKFFAAEELFFSRSLKQKGKFRIVKHPVITSARKLHSYSAWQLMRFLASPLSQFWAPLQSKKGLEILYEDRR